MGNDVRCSDRPGATWAGPGWDGFVLFQQLCKQGCRRQARVHGTQNCYSWLREGNGLNSEPHRRAGWDLSWSSQEVVGPQVHWKPLGLFPYLTGVEQPWRALRSVAQAKPETMCSSINSLGLRGLSPLRFCWTPPLGEHQCPLLGQEICRTE